MSDNQDLNEEENTEFMYEGHSIPKTLKWIYVIFLVWAVLYFALYGASDLSQWIETWTS